MTRYVFITGGVVSSLGKGLASAALGALLQARGFSVRLRKPRAIVVRSVPEKGVGVRFLEISSGARIYLDEFLSGSARA